MSSKQESLSVNHPGKLAHESNTNIVDLPPPQTVAAVVKSAVAGGGGNAMSAAAVAAAAAAAAAANSSSSNKFSMYNINSQFKGKSIEPQQKTNSKTLFIHLFI
jgi:hypothetical protein